MENFVGTHVHADINQPPGKRINLDRVTVSLADISKPVGKYPPFYRFSQLQLWQRSKLICCLDIDAYKLFVELSIPREDCRTYPIPEDYWIDATTEPRVSLNRLYVCYHLQ
jgi:hypothetical protein